MFRRLTIIVILLALCVPVCRSQKLERPRVALVLGGGGAKGAASIGALKYVEKAGVPVDLIVGTSAGAIIGSLYSVGYRAEELDSIYRAQDWLRIFADLAPVRKKLVRPKNFIPGMLSGDGLTEMMDSLLQHRECDFDSLPIPFRAMSTDALQFKEVCIDHGNLAEAVRASMSVPVVFRPIEQDSMSLVDGGLLNNLPVDVAFELGADIVIAIDLADARRAEQDGIGKGATNGMPAILTWKLARPDLQKYHNNLKAATLVIHPDVSGFNGSSFRPKDTEELIRRGERAGLDAWVQLVEIAGQCNK